MPVLTPTGLTTVGQAPIVLSTGALARYPLNKKYKFATKKIEFADFSRQTFAQLAYPLGSWVLTLNLLQDSEANDWFDFWRTNALGGYAPFTFADPSDNLLQYSEQQETNSVWAVGASTVVSSSAVADPFGLASGRVRVMDCVSTGNYLVQNVSIAPGGTGNSRTAGITFTASFYGQFVSGGPSSIWLQIDDGIISETAHTVCNLTSSWQRFSVKHTFAPSNPSTQVRVSLYNNSSSGNLNIFGHQLEVAGTTSLYKKTTAYCGSHPVCYFATDEFDHQVTEYNVNNITQLTIEEANAN
jgi:hypothetical protein